MSSEASNVPAPRYGFLSEVARIINAGQARAILLTGTVHDLFYSVGEGEGRYQPLVSALLARYRIPGLVRVVYELNGPIRFAERSDREAVRRAWAAWKTGADIDRLTVRGLEDGRAKERLEAAERSFEEAEANAIGQPSVALEFLRQLTVCARSASPRRFRLLIVVEAADMLLPAGDGNVAQLTGADRHRISICQDWFADPMFLDGEDSVLLLAESRSLVHGRVASLPQLMHVEVPSPDGGTRRHYIEHFVAGREQVWENASLGGEELARMTAGLSIHALRQMLLGAAHTGEAVDEAMVVGQVERYISSQLGEDVVEFKRPGHTLGDVIGFSRLKRFLSEHLVPRIEGDPQVAISGAAVAGPIGSGKTFIFEALAGSLKLPVLTLRNIRSQYFGQTDVIFERLRRVLESLDKVVVLVDEADTQIGDLGPDAHPTERRLVGRIQQMMSDTKLRGRVFWLLMTARIHRLSPDLRRPGRVGDLIIRVLDPEGEDRRAFVRWMLAAASEVMDEGLVARVEQLTQGYSAAAMSSLRSDLKSARARKKQCLAREEIEAIVSDHLPPDIEAARRYQTLQALVNCTRRNLLPDPAVTEAGREQWRRELRELEASGVR